MADYSKNVKRLLREFAAEAHEKELARELAQLDKSFSEWRDGKISSGELSYRIHQYETGPARQLFNKYNQGENDFNVAYAIVTDILNRQDVPDELIDAIDKEINFYESLKDAGKLRLPGE